MENCLEWRLVVWCLGRGGHFRWPAETSVKRIGDSIGSVADVKNTSACCKTRTCSKVLSSQYAVLFTWYHLL
jgi:hypothetical protein